MSYTTFDELFEIPLRNGLTKPKKVRGDGYKMINMGELFAYPQIKNLIMDRVPLNEREKNNSLVEQGDLLFARQSLVREGAGQCSIFLGDEEEVCFESHLIRCRLNKNIAHSLYYFYFFSSNFGKKIIDTIVEQGAGAAGIRGSDLAKLIVPKPDIKTQLNIAKVLSTIDDKIHLNNQINQTLESIAQAIFNSWFIDFEPVRAKIAAKQEGKDPELAAMCAISGKSEAELEQMEKEDFAELQATAALFPDDLIESELGDVPKGWEVSTIENCFHVVMGQSPKGETYNENQQGKIFFQGRAEFGWRYPSPRLYTTDPKRIAKMNDILLSVRAPVGDMNVALDECCIGRGLAALSHKSNHFSYSYYLLKSLKNKFDLFNGEGTVFGSINQKDLKNITLIEPNRNLIDRFAELVFIFDQKIKINSLNISQLIDIRDTLLPKLLSGEVDVSGLQGEGIDG